MARKNDFRCYFHCSQGKHRTRHRSFATQSKPPTIPLKLSSPFNAPASGRDVLKPPEPRGIEAPARGDVEFGMQGAHAEEIKLRLKSLKVLIVEDNAFMRKIVRDLLSNIGIRHMTEAADGVAGLEAIRNAMPDLVLLDWDMPFINGFEFIRIVRAPGVFPYSDLPIIMLSGYGERAHVMEAARLGVNEFLKK